MSIIELKKETYQGYKITLNYQSDCYYQVVINKKEKGYRIELDKKSFPSTFYKEMSATLFEEQWDDPSAYGYMVDEKIVAVMELNREKWNKRLRVTNITVDEAYRHQHIGVMLLNKAKEVAKEEGYRVVILETQTCNMNAIDFYLSQGFDFAGFDSTCYSDKDIQNNEVRIEMVYFI